MLPAILAQRRQNRGFEAVVIQNDKVYAFIQSPLRNPDSLSNATLNGLQRCSAPSEIAAKRGKTVEEITGA